MTETKAFRLFAASLLAIFLLAAVAIGCGDGDDDATTAAKGEPVIVEPDELADAADRLGQPIYWVGERDGTELELVEADSGRVYVRYLDEGEEAGVRSADFLTLATYPTQNPVAALRREAKERKRAEIARSEDGGVVLIDPDKPGNVYVAYPGDEYQIELYSPDIREGIQLATSGAVDPVR